MATLKEHQAAMVDLLANGSGIPASASRLAHAMHDVLESLLNGPEDTFEAVLKQRKEATTPGLNDKALSKREKALKTDSPAKWPTPATKAPVSAEQRVMQLENTCGQLRRQSAQYRATIANQKEHIEHLQFELAEANRKFYEPEQAGCRKEDTQVWEGRYAGVGTGL